MLKWQCEIPGPKDSPWEGGNYVLTMDFTHDFPVRYFLFYLDLPNVCSNLFYLIQTYILLEQYAFQFSMKKKTGNLILR